MCRKLFLALLGVVLLPLATAHAGGPVRVGVGVGVPYRGFYYHRSYRPYYGPSVGIYVGTPLYYAPAPIYYSPVAPGATVIVPPGPIYAQPLPPQPVPVRQPAPPPPNPGAGN
jgi:hypothetical protein